MKVRKCDRFRERRSVDRSFYYTCGCTDPARVMAPSITEFLEDTTTSYRPLGVIPSELCCNLVSKMAPVPAFLRFALFSSWALAVNGFGILRQRNRPREHLHHLTSLSAIQGDPLRAATGIRPSLHPLTINAISTVLQKRSTDKDANLRVEDPNVENLQVALAAGKIAAEALQKRQDQSKQDDMQLTYEEGQTVAGRIVGVTMRLPDLESLLYEKCKATSWIAKYGEWPTFGILPDESDAKAVDEQIKMDPLFAMNRAECLLALFLSTVEKPELAAKGASVPDESRVDFLDADRQEVLLEGSD